MSELLFTLINVDVPTLIAVLVWGNFASFLLISCYRFSNQYARENSVTRIYLFAKLFQALGCLCMFLRGVIPALLSVNLGNSLMFCGYYLEALMIFSITQPRSSLWKTLNTSFLVASLLVFNMLEFWRPDAALRVMVASCGVVLILAGPSLWLLLSRNSTVFKRSVGVSYCLFVFMMLLRIFYAFYNIEFHVLANSLLQSLTFFSMVLLMIFSLPAYLLLMKEKADKIISIMATMDCLTGLPNRYSFLDAAAQTFEKHRADGKSVAILYMDIDDFKQVNDTYGHAFGDDVLVRFGEVVRKTLRVNDLSCRYGGEEFLILLPCMEYANSVKVTERLMQEIRESCFSQNSDFSFTISIGLMCGMPGENDTLEKFISKADQALYVAKNTGKNKVVGYHSLNTEHSS